MKTLLLLTYTSVWGFFLSQPGLAGTTLRNIPFYPVDSLLPIHTGNFYGFINRQGEVVIPPRFRSIGKFTEGLCPARIDGHWGFIDSTGRYTIPPIYDYAKPFSDGMARVWKDSTLVYIDRQGSTPFTLPSNLIDGYDFKAGYAKIILKVDGRWIYYMVSKSGRVMEKIDWDLLEANKQNQISPPDQHANTVVLKHDRRWVSVEDSMWNETEPSLYLSRWGIRDTNGRWVCPPKFITIDQSEIVPGLRLVWEDSIYGYANRDGKYIWKTRYRQVETPLSAISDSVNIDYKNISRTRIWANEPGLRGELYTALAQATSLPLTKRNISSKAVRLDLYPKEPALFLGQYAGFRAVLRNTASDTVTVDTDAGVLYLKMQALDAGGVWRDIEWLRNSGCGNAYWWFALLPGESRELELPVYRGSFQTWLRVAFCPMWYNVESTAKRVWLYSDAFDGSVNPGQFWRLPKYDESSLSALPLTRFKE